MTPIFGPTTITRRQAETWALINGAHPRFIAVIDLYMEHGPRYGIPAENGLGQAAHETAFGRYGGQAPPEYHNWCGLKTKNATGDRPEDHMRFPSDGLGVIAHLQHLAGYGGMVAADLPDPLIDPRFNQITAHTDSIEGLSGGWAPSPQYGQIVAAKIAALKRIGIGMTAEVPGFAWVPETAGEFGYPQGKHGRNGYPIDRLIIHCTIATDSLAHLIGGHGNSVHLLDNRDGTPRAQMVTLADAAWGAGNQLFNLRSVNYEHEATGAEMLNPAYWTDSIIDNMARNAVEVLKLCPLILPDREHIIGHVDVPDQDHTDPGPVFPWARFLASIRRQMPATAEALVIPDNPHGDIPIVLGFRSWCITIGNARDSLDLNRGIVAVCGFPTELEWAGVDDRTFQRFERLTLVYNPALGVPFDVTPKLLDEALPERKIM